LNDEKCLGGVQNIFQGSQPWWPTWRKFKIGTMEKKQKLAMKVLFLLFAVPNSSYRPHDSIKFSHWQ